MASADAETLQKGPILLFQEVTGAPPVLHESAARMTARKPEETGKDDQNP